MAGNKKIDLQHAARLLEHATSPRVIDENSAITSDGEYYQAVYIHLPPGLPSETPDDEMVSLYFSYPFYNVAVLFY